MLRRIIKHLFHKLENNQGFLGGIIDDIFGGGDSALEAVKIPDYQKSPFFESSQQGIEDFSLGILGADEIDDIPEWIQPLITPQSGRFGQIGGNLIGRIIEGINEQSAAAGRGRGGAGSAAVAREVSPILNQFALADMLGMRQGISGLLGQSIGAAEGVRQGALQREGLENQFNLKSTDLALQRAFGLDEFNNQSSLAQGALLGSFSNIIGDIFSPGGGGEGGWGMFKGDTGSSIGAILGSIGAAAMGLPPQLGATVGGAIGGSIGSTGDAEREAETGRVEIEEDRPVTFPTSRAFA